MFILKSTNKDLVILVHVLVENCKEAIPLEGGWDGVNLWEKALVCKVGVLDVLSQPVLDEVGHLLRDWDLCAQHGVHQPQVPLPVVSNVMLVVPDGGEEGLLSTEVFVVEILRLVPQLLVVTVGLHVPDNVKKGDVFVVHLLVTDGKAILPDVRVGNNIVSPEVELSTVGKVGVLDVLSEPVLGLVGRLLGDWQLRGLELGLEIVMFEVVAVAVVALHPAELALLVVEVHPQLGLAEGSLLSVGWVVAALPDTVEQHLRRKTFERDLTKSVQCLGGCLYAHCCLLSNYASHLPCAHRQSSCRRS